MRVTAETLETNASALLAREVPKAWRKRYAAADLSGAVRSAAKSAIEHGKPVFVVASNSYGRFVWAVTLAERDVTCMVVNSGRHAFRVTPSREVFRLTVEV